MGRQIFIVSGPSGVGKTSLVEKALLDLDHLQPAVSHTTRPQRSGEKEAEDYYFVSDETFDVLRKQNAFIEHAEIFGYRYGTSRSEFQRLLDAGRGVVLEIDWQGAVQIRDCGWPQKSVFILPPSLEELSRRLRSRAKDPDEEIERRLSQAAVEMQHADEFDMVIVNNSFEQACRLLQDIFSGSLPPAEHRRQVKQVMATLP